MANEHSNTIVDFDAAKLQRLGYAGKSSALLLPVSLAELRQQLTLQLQTSLEAEPILSVFFQQLQRLVPLDALVYRHEQSELHIELGMHASHSASYGLQHDGAHLGELSFQRSRRFSEEELSQLETLLASLLFPLRNALLYRSAIRSAMRDPLTETGNRIAMDQALSREVELARRSRQPLSLLMLDIDHFKRINDLHGHSAGDQALKAVAATFKAQLRNVDMVFRYGGEEFVVLLSNTPREAAAVIGERLRQAVEVLRCPTPGHSFNLSISLGCAALLIGETAEGLLQRADQALFVAKRDGRNRLSTAS